MSNGFSYWLNDDDECQQLWIADKNDKRELNMTFIWLNLRHLHYKWGEKTAKITTIIRVNKSIFILNILPQNFHVNRSLKKKLKNKVYDDFDDLVTVNKKWVESNNNNFFTRGIDQMPK